MNLITEIREPYNNTVVSRVRWTDTGFAHQRQEQNGQWIDYAWSDHADLKGRPNTPEDVQERIRLWCNFWTGRGHTVHRLEG